MWSRNGQGVSPKKKSPRKKTAKRRAAKRAMLTKKAEKRRRRA